MRTSLVVAGFTLMAVVYMGGYISGGMYNPALSLGAWIRGLLTGYQCFVYCISQFLGGLVGGGVARFVIGNFLECGYDTAGKVCATGYVAVLTVSCAACHVHACFDHLACV